MLIQKIWYICIKLGSFKEEIMPTSLQCSDAFRVYARYQGYDRKAPDPKRMTSHAFSTVIPLLKAVEEKKNGCIILKSYSISVCYINLKQ